MTETRTARRGPQTGVNSEGPHRSSQPRCVVHERSGRHGELDVRGQRQLQPAERLRRDHDNKANATINVTGYSVTYDGAAHTATGSATGVNGESLAGMDLSGTSHTTAGSYNDSWTFTDVTGNYNNASGSVSDSIAKAEANGRRHRLHGHL
jgi:hypothetical protein